MTDSLILLNGVGQVWGWAGLELDRFGVGQAWSWTGLGPKPAQPCFRPWAGSTVGQVWRGWARPRSSKWQPCQIPRRITGITTIPPHRMHVFSSWRGTQAILGTTKVLALLCRRTGADSSMGRVQMPSANAYLSKEGLKWSFCRRSSPVGNIGSDLGSWPWTRGRILLSAGFARGEM